MSNHEITYNSRQRKLTIRNASIFPQAAFAYSGMLEILDASDNSFTSLPDNLSEFKNMRIAFLSGNKFRTIPKVLAGCTKLEMIGLKSCGIESIDINSLPMSLRGLILTDNAITNIPADINRLTRLQKLMLTGNDLSTLPDTMCKLNNLELIRVSGNRLERSSDMLSTMPNLAWFADSDNTFNATAINHTVDATFEWNDLTFMSKLGESSKNTVHAAKTTGGKEIAVKLFGDGITTDGSSDNDVRVSLMAGDHPNLIGGLGRLVNAPNNQQGLIMPIIPASYKTLGLPPDLYELTRDGYVSGQRFSMSFVMNVARDIAAALKHLHSKGIMHGDVYAHNILTALDGASVLGDFGAATIYPINDPSQQWREQFDVLGYGRLLFELLERSEPTNSDKSTYLAIHDITSRCMSPVPSQRLSFGAVCRFLD
ncbi:MAG: protein kinase [Chloroflexi bacterium]|nr:MAG: protein kinase [Chloroflexota bacterium]